MRGAAGIALACVACCAAAPAAHAAETKVRSGALEATFRDAPFSITFRQRGGPGLVARAVTPGARVRVRAAGEGAVAVEVQAPAGARAARMEFASPPGERFYGFGERSDAVERRGRQTENYVSDGPVRPEDYRYVKASVPPWADRERVGLDVLPGAVAALQPRLRRVDRRGRDQPLRHRRRALGGRRRRGPAPAARVRGTEARGCAAAVHGGGGPPARAAGAVDVRALVPDRPAQRRPGRGGAGDHPRPAPCRRPGLGGRDPDALPAVRRPQGARGGRAGAHRLVPPRTAWRGSCTSTRCCARRIRRSSGAQRPRACCSADPAGRRSSTRRSSADRAPRASPRSRSRSSTSPTPRPRASTRGWSTRRWTAAPTAGWRTSASPPRPPPPSTTERTGDAAHNRYPTDYHCALQRIARGFGRPLVRFLRSGWTGTARCAEVVWGGDPTHGLGLRRDQLRRHADAVDRAERRGALGHRHRRLRVLRRRLLEQAGRHRGGTPHPRAAHALDRARRACAGDAHQALGHRDPVLHAARRCSIPRSCECGGG